MEQEEVLKGNTGDNEYAVILLGGNYRVETDKGSWKTINGRKDVFSGIAHSLYVPPIFRESSCLYCVMMPPLPRQM